MSIKELKKNAFNSFKRNYFKIILVVFIVSVIVNGGYKYSSYISNNSNNNIKSEETFDNNIIYNGYKITKLINDNTINIDRGNKSNYQILNNLVDNISNRVSVGGHNKVLSEHFLIVLHKVIQL